MQKAPRAYVFEAFVEPVGKTVAGMRVVDEKAASPYMAVFIGQGDQFPCPMRLHGMP